MWLRTSEGCGSEAQLHLIFDLNSKEPTSDKERSEWMRLDHANSG